MLSCCLIQPLRQSTDLSIPHWMTTRLRMKQGCIFITLETSKVVTRFQSLRCWNQTAFIKCVQYFCIKIANVWSERPMRNKKLCIWNSMTSASISVKIWSLFYVYNTDINGRSKVWPINGPNFSTKLYNPRNRQAMSIPDAESKVND